MNSTEGSNGGRVVFAPSTDVVACSLDRDEAPTRIGEWQALLTEHLLRSEAVPGGVRLHLSADAADAARSLAEREASCCGFLAITVETASETVLTVTGDADAALVIQALVGKAV